MQRDTAALPLSRRCRAASFGTGLSYGGPVIMIWGWLGVSMAMLCIALGMAELASAYPTSGACCWLQDRCCRSTDAQADGGTGGRMDRGTDPIATFGGCCAGGMYPLTP